MHPEILRQLADQRRREMRARARQVTLARLATRIGRRGHRLPDEADEFVIPAIPDYVDGSFRTGPASTGPATTGPARTRLSRPRSTAAWPALSSPWRPLRRP